MMEQFLKAKATELGHYDPDWDHCDYRESDVPAADDGDAWLETKQSFIRRVGVLAVWDSNKTDYAGLFYGMMRSADSQPIFVGFQWFPEGENDDIGRLLDRYSNCIAQVGHPVFWGDQD